MSVCTLQISPSYGVLSILKSSWYEIKKIIETYQSMTFFYLPILIIHLIYIDDVNYRIDSVNDAIENPMSVGHIMY